MSYVASGILKIQGKTLLSIRPLDSARFWRDDEFLLFSLMSSSFVTSPIRSATQQSEPRAEGELKKCLIGKWALLHLRVRSEKQPISSQIYRNRNICTSSSIVISYRT